MNGCVFGEKDEIHQEIEQYNNYRPAEPNILLAWSGVFTANA